MASSPDLDWVFAAAIELSGDHRQSYIVQVCGSDDSLRKRVEELVAAHFEAGDFLEEAGPELTNIMDPVRQPRA